MSCLIDIPDSPYFAGRYHTFRPSVWNYRILALQCYQSHALPQSLAESFQLTGPERDERVLYLEHNRVDHWRWLIDLNSLVLDHLGASQTILVTVLRTPEADPGSGLEYSSPPGGST